MEPKKEDSNRKSYAQVLMDTSTAQEQIPDMDSRFSSLVRDDRNVSLSKENEKTCQKQHHRNIDW